MRTIPTRPCVSSLIAAVLAFAAFLGPAGASGREMPFLPPVAAGTGAGIATVAAADFDRDGDVDLAAISESQEEILWLEDTGAGFVQHLITGVLDAPHGLAAADVDCDGDPDLVIGVSGTDAIVWGRNDGGGSWSSGGLITASAAGLQALAAGDVDGDGAVDVVGGSSSGGGIVLWSRAGCGAAAIWASTPVAAPLSIVSSVALADLNGDGRIDVAATDSGTSLVGWWENPGGAGAWTSHTVDAAFGNAQSVAAGDVDGDGDVDLAAAANSASELAWWANSGDGSTWTKHTVAALPFALLAYLADVDRDGDLDLVGASSAAGEALSWWDNTAGDGTVWEAHALDLVPGVPRGLVVADLGADGDADVASAALTAGEVRVYENVSTARSGTLDEGQFTNAYPFSLRDIPDLEAGDVDGDGDPDLVIVDRQVSTPEDYVIWFENGGADAFGQLVLGGPHYIYTETLNGIESAAVGDVDGDGDADVFVGNTGTIALHGFFCRNDGVGWSCFLVVSTGEFHAMDGVALYDMDGDGDLDVLASMTELLLDPGYLAWWENAGDPTLAAGWIRHDIGASPGSDRLAAADLDGDGDLDVVERFNSWWRNDGGSWSQQSVPGSAIDDFALGDVDGDGDGDLAATILTVSGVGLAWFENDLTGSGTWTEHEVRPPDPQDQAAYQVALADLDVDGDPDVLATIVELGPLYRVAWFENQVAGGGPWSEHGAQPEGIRGVRLVAADFDVDGDPDVVSAADGFFQSWINGGGQFALATTDVAPAAIGEGEERAVFAVEVHHRGRAGEAALGLSALALLFEESFGLPLTDAQLAAVVETLRLYRDDGSGTFDPASDTEVGTFAAPPLAAGLGVLALPGGDAELRHAPAETPVTYFLTVELTADATAAGLASLRLTHAAGRGSAAENAEHATPLLWEYSPDVAATFAIVTPGIFADGFESGDTSRWSLVVQ